MLVGYARVSREEQTLAAQKDALNDAGCERIYLDRASGAKLEREQLERALDFIREGDTLVVWKLDRLSRSLADLLRILDRVEQSGARFRSLTETVETETPAGRMMMAMLGAFAEFEREMIRERTMAGLAAARARGRLGGRPPKLSREQRKHVCRLIEEGKSQVEVARLFGVHRATVSRIVREK